MKPNEIHKTMETLRNAGDTISNRSDAYEDSPSIQANLMSCIGAYIPLNKVRAGGKTGKRFVAFMGLIGKLARYISTWDKPDPDTLTDLIGYAAMLNTYDQEEE